MSIQTQIERIAGEVGDQKDLISQITTVLGGKAAGGGIIPTGTKTITENGTHDVANYASAEVNVPGTASGTKTITENGTHDVASYASAEVNVPGIVPTGTKTITQNGTHDVTNYANAEVNVPGIVPTGTKTITQNGTYDIAAFASAIVNVATTGGTGAGLPSGLSTVDTGIFAPTSDVTTTGKIMHSLGVAPDLVFIFADTDVELPSTEFNGYLLLDFKLRKVYTLGNYTNPYFGVALRGTSTPDVSTSLGTSTNQVITDSSFIFSVNSNSKFKAGVTYRWVACVFE